jgi:[NiFe] hydrogenase diaphorase moiety large subunit
MQSFIDETLKKYQHQTTPLLMVLRDVQAHYFHIPKQAIELIAKGLNIARTQIVSVVEFYHFFSFEPRGRYDIFLSDSITDHMLGKKALADYLCQKLNTPLGTVRADGVVSIDNTACTGLCDQGPALLVNGYAIGQLSEQRIDRIVALIEQNIPVKKWDSDLFEIYDNIQQPGLLLNSKLARGEALKVAAERGLTETLDEIKAASLRGRGGAGFTTAMKWASCRATEEKERYVVCNADEGEPGTFKDRVLLNSYTHDIIEGMTLCAAILGAHKGFIYLRGEYLNLFDKIQAVLQERRDAGLLGDDILGYGWKFDVEIRMGAGSYVCGESSALLESLEGKIGNPRNRPPSSIIKGYLAKPTVLNNVETFVAAAHIALRGSEWFASCGTEKSKGTKILSICGDCARPGIYEYPFGTTIQQVLDDCGATDVLGVQVGGPSGTFVSTRESDGKLTFEDLSTGGAFIIFNHSRNIFDIVQNYIHFFADESCGFCTPCRVGTQLLRKQFDKIHSGHGSTGDIKELQDIATLIRSTSHCGLGQTAAEPILTTLERYPDLYEKQIKQQHSFDPGFDLDASLAVARKLSGRDDSHAHLAQVEKK